MVRLAYGVVAGRDLGVWAPGLDGVIDAARATLAPGTPVVVGPRRRNGRVDEPVRMAVEGLTALVAAGGVVAAGAGVAVGAAAAGATAADGLNLGGSVDVGGEEFRTARLAGVAGDRRDAVLAALPVLGSDGSARLGDRAGLLVALFGPSATKPVGAAATAALHDGRWGVLHLASAASDMLGPEQLERVLRLTGPDGLDTETNGLASILAGHLDRVLGRLSKQRRLTLLLDLWAVVGANRESAARRQRRLDTQARDTPDRERLAEIRARYRHHVDQDLLATAAFYIDNEPPRPLDLAQWVPSAEHWHNWLCRTMHDALAATVLLRAATAIADHGPEAGLAEVRSQLATAPFLISKRETKASQSTVDGLIGVPGRPGAYVLDIDRRLRPGKPIDQKTVQFVRQRLAHATNYGVVVLEAAQELFGAFERASVDLGGDRECPQLTPWREAVGYTPVRPPENWEQPVIGSTDAPLAQRLREQPDATPETTERAADLLWLADLADALAQLDGHPAAVIGYNEAGPSADVDPRPPAADPLRPAEDSVALALAGAAQLIDLGAEPLPKARSWPELVDGLLASTVVTEALTGTFPVAEPLRSRDGTVLPGTDVRLELAHDPHQLVEWAQFMGNCIAGRYYLDEAGKGRSVLAALRDPAGRLLANLELRPTRTGWSIDEFKARFNAEPEEALAAPVRAWVAALPRRPPARSAVAPRAHPHGSLPRSARRVRMLGDVRGSLVPLVVDAMATADPAAWDVMSLAGTGAASGLAGVTALRRARDEDLDAALLRSLAGDGPDLLSLWRATAVRPLATAVTGLDPTDRPGYLDLLLGDGPLPAAQRRLVRSATIAEARTVDLVARRLRRAIGRLARAADPVLAPLVPGQADTNLLCALVLTVSTAGTAPAAALTPITRRGEVAVPGFPPSTLDDESGPWRVSSAAAAELGAELSWHLPPPALTVPSAWLGRGGWPALWARANRATVAATRRATP